MIKKQCFAVGTLLWLGLVLYAQNNDQVTNAFVFKDGIYRTFEEFQRNQPFKTWDEVDASAYRNREKYKIQFEFIRDTASGKVENLLETDLWGVCVEGVPHLRWVDSTHGQTYFVGLRTRGKICYFYYSSFALREVPMTIYNPATRLPVYTKSIFNKEPVTIHKFFRFNDGKVEDFSVKNFLPALSDDKNLLQTLADMPRAEIAEKLYRTMLIYNDRNPVYIQK